MSTGVLLLVLLAALMHASWNVMVKGAGDRLITMAAMMVGAGLLAVPLLPFVPLPAPEAWWCLLASVTLHLGYYACLLRGYAHGDLGQVYPLARGSAPLLVAIGSFVMTGEQLSGTATAAVVLLAVAIMSLALRGGRRLRDDPRPVLYALGTGLFIAAYTVADGMGGRLAGNAHSYALWLFAIDAVPVFLLAWWRRGGALFVGWRAAGPTSLAGAALSMGAYWLAIWAMTVAPMAVVSAVRESSVVFAAVLSVVVLKERLVGWRVVASVVVVAGIALLRL